MRNIAIIILFDKEKKILLQHRAEDATRLPGYWAFFGGGIETGESPEQTVVRETKEELDYALTSPKLIMAQEFSGGTKHVFVEEYDPQRKLTLGEGQGMGWYSLAETKKLKIVDHDVEVLEYIQNKY